MLKQDTRIVNLARALALVLGVTGASSALADGTEAYTGNYPTAMAVGDLNGDGMPDVAVVNMNDSNVSVIFNTTGSGDTSLSLADAQDFDVDQAPMAVAIADVNGDGKPDLIIGCNYTSTITVLINDTVPGSFSASFEPAQTFPAGNGVNALVMADINGDGKPDAILNDWNNSAVAVLINSTADGSATASFDAAQEFTVGSTPYSLAAGDLNGDGLPDLAVVNFDDSTVSVLINSTANGSSTASFAAQQVFAAGNQPQAVAIGDLNGDGKADLAVAGVGDSNVAILLNGTAVSSSTAVFSAQQLFDAALCSNAVAIADVNGDGKADVISPDACGNNVAVLVNTTPASSGSASFVAKQVSPVSEDSGWALAGAAIDMNGDGMPELVNLDTANGEISVQLDATAPGDTSVSFLP